MGTDMKPKIIQEVIWGEKQITIKTDLPPAGYTMVQLASFFKQELADLLRKHRDRFRGKVVYFSGRMGLAMGITAGFMLKTSGATDIDIEVPQDRAVFRCAGHNDPDAPVPLVYEVGMVVVARIYGHEVEVAIISASVGGRFQVERDRQRTWVGAKDIVRFVRYLHPGERL